MEERNETLEQLERPASESTKAMLLWRGVHSSTALAGLPCDCDVRGNAIRVTREKQKGHNEFSRPGLASRDVSPFLATSGRWSAAARAADAVDGHRHRAAGHAPRSRSNEGCKISGRVASFFILRHKSGAGREISLFSPATTHGFPFQFPPPFASAPPGIWIPPT
jgi:hypothetical protein